MARSRLRMFRPQLKVAYVSSCKCTGRNGQKKTLYLSERDAVDQADYAMIERDTRLSVYPCPYGKGHHLTSK